MMTTMINGQEGEAMNVREEIYNEIQGNEWTVSAAEHMIDAKNAEIERLKELVVNLNHKLDTDSAMINASAFAYCEEVSALKDKRERRRELLEMVGRLMCMPKKSKFSATVEVAEELIAAVDAALAKEGE
jgi:hypothetical protein